MKKLRKKEKILLYAAGIITVLILGQTTVIRGMREQIRDLQTTVKKREQDLTRARELKWLSRKHEDDIIRYIQIISKRPKDFSLADYVSEVEKSVNFIFDRMEGGVPKEVPGTLYRKTESQYTYRRKSLDQVRQYLYEIEDPSKAITIEGLTLNAKSKGKLFEMDIWLSVLTRRED